MKATELIEKKVIRTSPYKNSNDFSFTKIPIFIVSATHEHIVYKIISPRILSKYEFILDYNWCDDNWINYEEFVKKGIG